MATVGKMTEQRQVRAGTCAECQVWETEANECSWNGASVAGASRKAIYRESSFQHSSSVHVGYCHGSLQKER